MTEIAFENIRKTVRLIYYSKIKMLRGKIVFHELLGFNTVWKIRDWHVHKAQPNTDLTHQKESNMKRREWCDYGLSNVYEEVYPKKLTWSLRELGCKTGDKEDRSDCWTIWDWSPFS